jgi:hypothetical protein
MLRAHNTQYPFVPFAGQPFSQYRKTCYALILLGTDCGPCLAENMSV